MLRRRFSSVVAPSPAPVFNTQVVSSNHLCVCLTPTVTTSGAGMFSVSSLFLAPSPPSKTRRIKAHGIILRRTVKPVFNWEWDPFCTQFTKLVHSPSLDLPNQPPRKMDPAMQVFAALDIDETILRDKPRDEKTGNYVLPYAHCKVEEVAKKLQFGEREAAVELIERLIRHLGDDLPDNLSFSRCMYEDFADFLSEERSRRKRRPGFGPYYFLQLTGFHERDYGPSLNPELIDGPMHMHQRVQNFKISGLLSILS